MALDITPASTSVTVEWPQVTDATNYKYQFFTDFGGSPASNFFSGFTTGALTITKTGLTANTVYWVLITPYNSSNQPMADEASEITQFTTTA